MSEMSITVIVPIYNASHYLYECIHSIIKQTCSDFELLLIDDGSTDNSSDICNFWVEKDGRIKYFRQENSGASSARNHGLRKAQGDWVIFIDSDDYVLPNYLSDLYDITKKNTDVDLCIDGVRIYQENKQIRLVSFENKIYSADDALQLFCDIKIHKYGYSVGKLYKKSIIDKYHLRFDENICIAEDSVFMMNFISKCSHIAFCNKCNYIYNLHSNSLSTSVSNYEKELYSYNAYKDIIISLKKQYNMTDDAFEYLYSPIVFFIDRVLNSIYIEQNTPYKQRLEKIRRINIEEFRRFKKSNSWKEWVLKEIFVHRFFRLYDLLRIIK